jgi:hypothetical protein
MPALPLVPGVIRIRALFTDAAGSGVFGCRYYMQYSGGSPSIADLGTINTAWAAKWGTRMAPFCDPDISLVGVHTTDLATASGSDVNSTFAVPGTHASPIPTRAACAVVVGHIARRYRGGKPKIFLPCGTVADKVSDGRWTTTFAANVGTAWTNLQHDVEATPGLSMSLVQPVNVSFYQGYNAPVVLPSGRSKQTAKVRVTPLVDAIVTYTCDQQIGSQRRRLSLG